MNEAEYLAKNYGDRVGCYGITPSEISIILHMIQKPNSIIVLLFIQSNSQFKGSENMLTSIDVKFIFDSARLGLFSSANILQIADVALRVVFLLFLPCFQLFFRLVLTLETSEMSAIFVFTTKTTQPRPQVFSVNAKLTYSYAALLTSSVN